MIDEIRHLSHLLKSNAPYAEIREQAYHVYRWIGVFIRQEASEAETLDDFTALDDFRVVQTLLKNKFRF